MLISRSPYSRWIGIVYHCLSWLSIWLYLSACTSQSPEVQVRVSTPIAPAPPVTQTPQQPTSTPPTAAFWLPDNPRLLPPQAYGVLPAESQPLETAAVQEFVLPPKWPTVPATLPVYQVGSYPVTATRRLLPLLPRGEQRAWSFNGEYSLVQYRGDLLVAPPEARVSSATATAYATYELQRRGLLPDGVTPVAKRQDDGGWQVRFMRQIQDVSVYTNKGLAVTIAVDGRVEIIGRRRPLLDASAYPTRTPEQAWQAFVAGQGRRYYVDDDSPGNPLTVTDFVVTQIEIVYLETEVVTTEQIMQPYYAIRDAAGYVLYVPAIAESFIKR